MLNLASVLRGPRASSIFWVSGLRLGCACQAREPTLFTATAGSGCYAVAPRSRRWGQSVPCPVHCTGFEVPNLANVRLVGPAQRSAVQSGASLPQSARSANLGLDLETNLGGNSPTTPSTSSLHLFRILEPHPQSCWNFFSGITATYNYDDIDLSGPRPRLLQNVLETNQEYAHALPRSTLQPRPSLRR